MRGFKSKQSRRRFFVTNSDVLIPVALDHNVVDLSYFKHHQVAKIQKA